MADDRREYRVVFLHIQNGVKFEVFVAEPTEFHALRAGLQRLEEHLQSTAGHVSDWVHYSTAKATT